MKDQTKKLPCFLKNKASKLQFLEDSTNHQQTKQQKNFLTKSSLPVSNKQKQTSDGNNFLSEGQNHPYYTENQQTQPTRKTNKILPQPVSWDTTNRVGEIRRQLQCQTTRSLPWTCYTIARESYTQLNQRTFLPLLISTKPTHKHQHAKDTFEEIQWRPPQLTRVVLLVQINITW